MAGYIGLTGPLYAGKTETSARLAGRLGYERRTHSEILRELTASCNVPNTRDSYSAIFRDLVMDYGTDVLARALVARNLPKGTIIDGIRNLAEAAWYRNMLPGFLLIAINASPFRETSRCIRYSRYLKNPREIDALGEPANPRERFVMHDDLEWGGQVPYYNIKGVMTYADAHLLNSGALSSLYWQIDQLIATADLHPRALTLA